MKKIIFLFALVAIFTACQPGIEGSGKVVDETREAAPFERIDVEGAFEIYVRSGNYSAVTIKADENLLPYIETYVKGGTLYVSSERKFSYFKNLKLYLTMGKFNGAELSGACELHSEGPLSGEDVELDFSGAVEADLELNCKSLEVDMSGASELNLTGVAEKLNAESSGAGELNAENFKTRICRLDMSGAGEATVYVTEKLDVDVSGAAEIRYRGNPGEVSQNISGAATIKPL